MATPAEIENQFTYHAPTGEQPGKYRRIRAKALELALLIAEETPSCPDQEKAIQDVRSAVMFANAAIACDGR